MAEQKPCMHCQELLPWYSANTLASAEHAFVEQHLTSCTTCQRQLAQWHDIAIVTREEQRQHAIQPVIPYTRSWESFQLRLEHEPQEQASVFHVSQFKNAITAQWQNTLDLARIQLRLIHIEYWILQGLALLLAIIVIFLPLNWTARLTITASGTIILGAISTAFLYSPHTDSMSELTLTTSTSPRLLFLLRLTFLVCSQGVVNGASMLVLLLAHQSLAFTWLATYWLAPLCCLIALSLFLATMLGSIAAILLSCILWISHLVSTLPSLQVSRIVKTYQFLWQQTPLFFLIALLALVLAFLLLERKEGFA